MIYRFGAADLFIDAKFCFMCFFLFDSCFAFEWTTTFKNTGKNCARLLFSAHRNAIAISACIEPIRWMKPFWTSCLFWSVVIWIMFFISFFARLISSNSESRTARIDISPGHCHNSTVWFKRFSWQWVHWIHSLNSTNDLLFIIPTYCMK